MTKKGKVSIRNDIKPVTNMTRSYSFCCFFIFFCFLQRNLHAKHTVCREFVDWKVCVWVKSDKSAYGCAFSYIKGRSALPMVRSPPPPPTTTTPSLLKCVNFYIYFFFCLLLVVTIHLKLILLCNYSASLMYAFIAFFVWFTSGLINSNSSRNNNKIMCAPKYRWKTRLLRRFKKKTKWI